MADQAKKLLALIRRTQALGEAMDAYLQEYPSPRVAHYIPSAAIGALQRELADIGIRAQREADRTIRKMEAAAEREAAKWPDIDRKAATDMGFVNPADWRAFVDSGAPRHQPHAWRLEHDRPEIEGWTQEAYDALIAERKARHR